MLIEVCAGSLKDCLVAQQSGANRIELNSGLFLGGLTPSLATLILAKKEVSIPIICMVRPRGAGFCYDDYDKKVMFHDAKLLLENGADGIAFGFLNGDRTIDEVSTKQMIDLIHSYGKEAVFHRAIDCVEDIIGSVETLITLGCNRILTSGGQPTVDKGKSVLKQLQQRYGNTIEFVMGGGVHADNITELAQYTNINQCHGSFKGWYDDNTTSTKSMSYRYIDKDVYDGVDEYKLKKFINSLGE